MQSRITKVRNLLHGLGDTTKKPKPVHLSDMLQDVKSVVKGTYKGRKPSISASNIGSLTSKEMWLILNDRGDEIKPDFSPELKFKMLSGGLIEHAWVMAMREAGIEVVTSVDAKPIEVCGITIKGTPDYVIDGKVWDCKTTNMFSFQGKFKDAYNLVEQDKYGYLCQLKVYSLMTGLPMGGWDVIDTNFFNFKSIEAKDIEMEIDMAWEAAQIRLQAALIAERLEDLDNAE